jgi:hypothetical protein
MVIIVILGGAGLFFVKDPNGKPFLTIDDFTKDFTMDLAEDFPVDFANSTTTLLREKLQPEASGAVTRIYKWKDKDGVWQFSNSPEDKEGSVLIEINGQTNIIQAFIPPPSSDRVNQGGMVWDEQVSESDPIPGVMTVSPEQAAEMMETVKNLQSTMDQRKATLDALSGVND